MLPPGLVLSIGTDEDAIMCTNKREKLKGEREVQEIRADLLVETRPQQRALTILRNLIYDSVWANHCGVGPVHDADEARNKNRVFFGEPWNGIIVGEDLR